MNIKLKLVKRCSNNEYGTTEVINKDNVIIELSTTKNKTPVELITTILHELLHVWLLIMETNGFKPKKQHRFIYSVQAVIIEALRLISKGKL